jgi:hypothetical protein
MRTFTIAFFLMLCSLLKAESFFSLEHIKKVYPVIEIKSDKIEQKHKAYIQEEINRTLKELGIDSSGHDPRAFAIVVTQSYVGDTPVLRVELLMGEEMKRLDDGHKSFAITYQQRELTVIEDIEDSGSILEAMEDSVDTLLERFAEQYREDNKLAPKEVYHGKESFAQRMGYETDYQTARTKAQKEGKNILLVLTTNYCPWCRKFEQNVLQKKSINRAIHKKYVPVILNRDEKKFPEKFTSSFTPVTYFIDAKSEEILHQVAGYNNRDEFMHLIQ